MRALASVSMPMLSRLHWNLLGSSSTSLHALLLIVLTDVRCHAHSAVNVLVDLS